MRQLLKIATMVLILCCTATGHAWETKSEDQIKAAYLYNFTKFIRWPKSAFSDQSATLVIGVLGQDDFNGALEPLSSRRVHNRPIEIRYFKTVQEVQSCHMLYISTYGSTETASTLKKLRTRPIITVGGNQNFAEQGGVIQLITLRGRLRFIINLGAAKIQQVKIDSQLLSLATEVLEAER